MITLVKHQTVEMVADGRLDRCEQRIGQWSSEIGVGQAHILLRHIRDQSQGVLSGAKQGPG